MQIKCGQRKRREVVTTSDTTFWHEQHGMADQCEIDALSWHTRTRVALAENGFVRVIIERGLPNGRFMKLAEIEIPGEDEFTND